MNRITHIVCIICLALGSLTAQAQFNKPLQSPSQRRTSDQAQFNIGITGGMSLTHWIHTGGAENHFNQPFVKGLCPVAGLSLETMCGNNISIGLEGLYAMRRTTLTYDRVNLPVSTEQTISYRKTYSVEYNQAEIQIPVTLYLSKNVNDLVKPYVFVAPRVSIPLNGVERLTRQYIDAEGNLQYDADNNPMYYSDPIADTLGTANFRNFNAGLAAGFGLVYKINTNNYYFLLKLDASAHINFINSYTEKQISGEIPVTYGANNYEPTLTGKRFITDGTVKATFLFPIKRHIQGACISWGEYD